MLEALTAQFAGDPILAYSLLAAGFLALVSLTAGLLRGDVIALARPSVTLKIAVAVALGLVLGLLGQALSDGTAASWSLAGLRRLPLYLTALAYGPGAGLFAAGLFAAFEATGGTLGWRQAILALELVALGWLAIYPNPFFQRAAGPFNALLAYLLAWGTAGVALLEYERGTVTLEGLWAQHQEPLLGLLLSAVLLALLGPKSYAALFPESRIAARRPRVAVSAAAPELEALERPAIQRDPSLPLPELPDRLTRQRQAKVLEPPPFDASDENL